MRTHLPTGASTMIDGAMRMSARAMHTCREACQALTSVYAPHYLADARKREHQAWRIASTTVKSAAIAGNAAHTAL